MKRYVKEFARDFLGGRSNHPAKKKVDRIVWQHEHGIMTGVEAVRMILMIRENNEDFLVAKNPY